MNAMKMVAIVAGSPHHASFLCVISGCEGLDPGAFGSVCASVMRLPTSG